MTHKNGEDLLQEQLKDWTFVCCCKTISSARPPVYNAGNCSCFRDCPSRGDTAIPANIEAQIADAMSTMNIHSSIPMDIPMPHSSPSGNFPFNHSQTASSISSAASIRAPCGPERRSPADKYLQVGPAVGLGELVHHHRAAFDQVTEDHLYGLYRWLESVSSWEPASRAMYNHDVGGVERPRWLRQDPHISGGGVHSVKAAKGSSKMSIDSSVLLVNADTSGRSNDLDGAHLTGQWVMGDVFDASGTLVIDDHDEDGDWNGCDSVF